VKIVKIGILGLVKFAFFSAISCISEGARRILEEQAVRPFVDAMLHPNASQDAKGPLIPDRFSFVRSKHDTLFHLDTNLSFGRTCRGPARHLGFESANPLGRQRTGSVLL